MVIREFLMASQVGICLVLIIFCSINNSFSKRKRLSILALSSFSMLLAVADYLVCLEEVLDLSFIKISKFFVYLMPLLIVFAFNNYLKDFIDKEKLKVVDLIIICGILSLIISQFNGWYYVYNENGYERGIGYLFSYLFPLIGTTYQLIQVIINRREIHKNMLYPMILFIILPIVGSVAHIFVHGISLLNPSVILMIILLYSFSIIDNNYAIKLAHQKELEALQEKEQSSKLMIQQVTSALAEAIDAKDSYTQGHSRRVAEYSNMIAKKAGKSEQECEEIRFIGLLHDVGKIGIPSSIINKTGKLSDEEFESMKKHPIIGREILNKITIDPSLRIGASFHHERYDGKGYPFGLKGDEIPEIARIIAVADAYDAMTSKRSYRDSLPQSKVRDELQKGLGLQFDPKFGQIMIELVDEDKNYNLRQH